MSGVRLLDRWQVVRLVAMRRSWNRYGCALGGTGLWFQNIDIVAFLCEKAPKRKIVRYQGGLARSGYEPEALTLWRLAPRPASSHRRWHWRPWLGGEKGGSGNVEKRGGC